MPSGVWGLAFAVHGLLCSAVRPDPLRRDMSWCVKRVVVRLVSGTRACFEGGAGGQRAQRSGRAGG